ncbi:MAG: restriction endonuclease subunit S [Prevotella sp.]|nr:restriction endonuclease subunit S [Candidatus Prevotella equi]
MKQGWTYKKLNDCCEIEYGTRVVQKKDGGTVYPVYGGGGETFRMDRYNREDCLVVARFAMSKTCVRYVTGKFFLNDSGLSINAGDELLQSYLNHHIMYLNDDIYNLGKGAAQRNLDVNAFRKLTIAIPSLSIQQSIVSELDKINELIRLKKEQLSDYDKLAQSIFYEMFGDPTENEKCWEVKNYDEICTLITDGEHNTPKRTDSGIFLLSARNIANHCLNLNDVDYIDSEEYDRISKRVIPQENDILISCSGSVGRVCSIPKGFRCQMVRSVALIRLKENVDNTFMEYLITLPYTQNQIDNSKTKSAQSNLFQGRIKKLRAIIPPISLQKTFSQRIDVIEQQKTEIQSTIADLETLLASRMQYWFE